LAADSDVVYSWWTDEDFFVRGAEPMMAPKKRLAAERRRRVALTGFLTETAQNVGRDPIPASIAETERRAVKHRETIRYN
jgi:hypothetical protein